MTNTASDVAFELDLQHCPEKVWQALTDPQLLSRWLLPSLNFKLEVGSKFTFKAPPQPGWDGVVNCQMLEAQPYTKLSYAWAVGEIYTTVSFVLIPTASGTHLSLVQSGFRPDQKQNLAGARYGWKKMTDRLLDLLETNP